MGCGVSTTTGQKAIKITMNDSINNGRIIESSKDNGTSQRPLQNNKVAQRKVQQTPVSVQTPVPITSENNRRINEELNNNPNFFYNEEYYLQQALQQSLGTENIPSNEDELFNQLLKETLVMSRKEYDDIGRKEKEAEILKIKDDPVAMQKKLEALLNSKKLDPKAKKLPPLAMLNKKPLNNKKGQEKKDLSKMKAPILMKNSIDQPVTNRSSKDVNDTESEIDIKDQNKMDRNEIAPSYNPRLLEKQKREAKMNVQQEYNFNSLESREYGMDDAVPSFAKYDNVITNNDDEYQNLINYLDDDDEGPRRNRNSAQESTIEPHNRYNNSGKKLNTKDSFDELLDDIDDEAPKRKPGPARVQIIGHGDYSAFDLD